MTVFYEKTNKTDNHHASPSSFTDFFGKNKYGKNLQNMGDGRSERSGEESDTSTYCWSTISSVQYFSGLERGKFYENNQELKVTEKGELAI